MQRAPRSLPFLLTLALFLADPRALSGVSPVPWDWKWFTGPSPFVNGVGRKNQGSVVLSHLVLDPGVDYFPLHLVALLVEEVISLEPSST